MIHLTTATEFNKRLEEKDMVALVAKMLAAKAFISTDLNNSTKFVIQSYMDKAKELIKNMEEFNIGIYYKE